MPSATARARCPRDVPRCRPDSCPRACGAQYGAPSPASAGTKVTPPASGTVPPTASSSDGAPSTPMPVSHRSAEPAVYTWPSRQYVTAPPSRQATEQDSPEPDRTAEDPVVTSRNAPVP